MVGAKKSGIEIKTFCSAGRFQHDVRFCGEIRDVPQEVVDMLQTVNEKLYEFMP